MNLSFKQLATYVSLLAIGSGAGMVGSHYLSKQQKPAVDPFTAPTVLKSFSSSATSSPVGAAPNPVDKNFIAEAAERVGPAVVRIDAARKVGNDVPDVFQNPLFRRFFGD